MPPTRTFGPYLGDSVFGGPNLWKYLPIYLVGPIVGATVAAFSYAAVAGLRTYPHMYIALHRHSMEPPATTPRARAPRGRIWRINIAH